VRLLRRPHLSRVATASARVAVVATAIVAAVYLAIAGGVVAIVQRDLTSQVDDHLRHELTEIGRQPPPQDGGGFRAPTPGGGPGDDRYGPALLVWTVHSNGTVTSTDANAVLPASYRSVGEPQTISIGNSSVRVEGSRLGGGNVVVGTSMASVDRTRSTLVFAEAAVGPVLLLAVFLGAFAIGRRVAAPIEHMRQRQMEFTADASHELRTPLSVIEATTTLALSREREAAWYRTAFERVHVEGQRMRRLVEDMLWLARFDATRGQPGAQLVDAGVLAGRAAHRFMPMAEARRLTLSFQAEEGEPAVVAAPPEWLDRMLGVLLDNACKYSGPGGTVDVRVGAEGSRVRLTVDDSGPGIPPDQRPRIFDRFHRATDQPGGAGLGLAIADAVVRATGGRWEMGSSPAGGARMSVTWPRVLAGAREGAAAPAPRSPA
jgi:signal transduction histidine kinase